MTEQTDIKATEQATGERVLRFRGKGEDDFYEVLLDGQDIGRVNRIQKGENAGAWTFKGAGKGFTPGPRKRAAIALSGLAPEQVKVLG